LKSLSVVVQVGGISKIIFFPDLNLSPTSWVWSTASSPATSRRPPRRTGRSTEKGRSRLSSRRKKLP